MAKYSSKEAYDLVKVFADKMGYQLDVDKRGPMVYEGKLKQGGPTVANQMLAELARKVVSSGLIGDLDMRQALTDLSSELEAADTHRRLKREVAKAPGKEAQVRVPIHSRTGRPLGIQRPDGSIVKLHLKQSDVEEVESLMKGAPKISGYFQKPGERKEGVPYDPVVNIDAYGPEFRRMVLKKVLARNKEAGGWVKGSKVVEMYGTKTALPRERGPRRIPEEFPGETADQKKWRTGVEVDKETGKEKPTEDPGSLARMQAEADAPDKPERFRSALEEAAAEALGPKNRNIFGQIKGGGPMVSSKPEVQTEAPREFKYDLPPGVDQVLVDGKYMFSYPGSKKPGTIDDVYAYFKKQVKGLDPDALDNLKRVATAKEAIKFQMEDPSGADTALDTYAGVKARKAGGTRNPDEYEVAERRASKKQMYDEMAPSDRKAREIAAAIRAQEENKEPYLSPGRRLFSATESKQWKFMNSSAQKLKAYLRKSGMPEPEIEAKVLKILKPYIDSIHSVKFETRKATKKSLEKPQNVPYFQMTKPDAKGKSMKAIILPGKGQSMNEMDGIRAYEVRAATQVIKALQAEEAKVRLAMGENPEDLRREGLSLSRKSVGKRPFNASKTKDIVTSPFARTAEEVGAAQGAAANRGTKLGTMVESAVRDLLKRNLSKPELETALNSVRKRFKERHNLSPANFMRIASAFDDRIKDLVTVDITTAAQQKQRREFLDRPDVRSSEGQVGTPSTREKTVEQILEEHKKRGSWNQAAEAEQQGRISKRIAEYLRLAQGKADISVGAALSPAERTQAARAAKGAPEEVMARAGTSMRRSLEGKRDFAIEDKRRRVAAKLKQLMDPRTSAAVKKLLAHPANRAKYGDVTTPQEIVPNMLRKLLEEHVMGSSDPLTEYFGPAKDTGVSMPFTPRELPPKFGPPVETEVPDLGALLGLGKAGRPVQGPAPAPAPREIPPVEARLSAKILERLKKTGSYKRPTRRR
jgi:hypothetical protein